MFEKTNYINEIKKKNDMSTEDIEIINISQFQRYRYFVEIDFDRRDLHDENGKKLNETIVFRPLTTL